MFQGGKINQAMRLMGAGIEVQTSDGRFVRFIENDPQRPKEYEEFRRIAAHLQWLNDNRQLFVRPLVFNETLIADFKNTPSAADINNGFNMGLRWRQKPNGNYELTRLQSGWKITKRVGEVERLLEFTVPCRQLQIFGFRDGSHATPCWREMDSNSRSPSAATPLSDR